MNKIWCHLCVFKVQTQLSFTYSKVNNRIIRKRCEIYLKLTIKISERRQQRRYAVLLLTLNMFHTPFFSCFYCWIWTSRKSLILILFKLNWNDTSFATAHKSAKFVNTDRTCEHTYLNKMKSFFRTILIMTWSCNKFLIFTCSIQIIITWKFFSLLR